MKYVIVEDHTGVIQPILFAPFLDHNRLTPGLKVHAAGFVSLQGQTDGTVKAQVWAKARPSESEADKKTRKSSKEQSTQIIINPNK